jgi:hypothetical protein
MVSFAVTDCADSTRGAAKSGVSPRDDIEGAWDVPGRRGSQCWDAASLKKVAGERRGLAGGWGLELRCRKWRGGNDGDRELVLDWIVTEARMASGFAALWSPGTATRRLSDV